MAGRLKNCKGSWFEYSAEKSDLKCKNCGKYKRMEAT